MKCPKCNSEVYLLDSTTYACCNDCGWERHADFIISDLEIRAEKAEKEAEDLFYKLTGVMHSIDKWWDENEKDKHGMLIANMDEVQRGCYVREKCLQIIEKLQEGK